MENFIETLKKRLQAWHEERAEKQEAKRQARLDAESRKVIQVMEYNGELYVSAFGVPLLGKDAIAGQFAAAVKDARQTYKDWKEEKLWERRGTTHAFTLF